MKTIKISDEAWQGLMQLKIEYKKRSIDEVVKALLKDTTRLERATDAGMLPKLRAESLNV